MAASAVAVLLALSGAGPCAKHLSPTQFTRAVDVAYGGTRTPTRRDQANLRRYVRCAPAWSRPYDRNVWTLHKRANAQRRWALIHPPFQTAFVSYYDDAGTHCCGVYATYGVAVCGSGGGPCVPQGTKIEFCLRGCVVATADDAGPYVPGREFDLSSSTAAAIGFSGLGYVRWRLRQ